MAILDISDPATYTNPKARETYDLSGHFEFAGEGSDSAEDEDDDPEEMEQKIRAVNRPNAQVKAPTGPPPGTPPAIEGRRVISGDISASVEKMGYERATDCLFASVVVCDAETSACKRMKIKIPLSEIRRKCTIAISKRVGSGQALAGYFEDVFGGIKNASNIIVKNLGIDKLGTVIKGVVADPQFQDALKLGGTIFPPLGISYNAVSKAADLVEAHQAGDPAATTALKAIAAGAQAGDPAAIRAAIAVNVIAKAKSGGLPIPQQLELIKKGTAAIRSDDPRALAQLQTIDLLIQQLIAIPQADKAAVKGCVSGWLYNRNYRGLIEAAVQPSPGMAIRKWYNEGSTALVDLIKKKEGVQVAGEALTEAETGRYWR